MVDVAIIVVVVVFALIGFMRGTWNSLFKLIMAILCIPLAIFIGNASYEAIAGVNINEISQGRIPIESINELGAFLRGLNPMVDEIFTAVPSLDALVTNWTEVFAKVIMIYLIGLILFSVMVLISNILWFLLVKHIFPKAKIRIGGAVISAVQAVVIVGFALMPVIIARPLVANLQESNIVTEDMGNTISSGTDFVDESFSIGLITKLSSPFTAKIGNYTSEDVTYNVFVEFNEAIDLIDFGVTMKDTFDAEGDMFNIDFENMDVNELRAALNNIGDELTNIDDSLNALSQTSNIRNVTEELIIYLLDTLFSESGELGTIDLSGLDFSEEFNIKDQVMPLLLSTAISNLESQYSFLAGYDLNSMTFDEIVDEIIAFAAAAALFDDISSIMDDINNIDNIDPLLMQQYFEDIANSEIASDLLENAIEELSGNTGLDIQAQDILDEGLLMSRLMALSQSTNPDEQECIDVALGVANSTSTYQFVLMMTSPTTHMVTVNATIYANIQTALATADPAIDPVVQANVMNIYQIG